MFKAFLDDYNIINIFSDKATSFLINDAFLATSLIDKNNDLYHYKAKHNIDMNKEYIISDENKNTEKLIIRYAVKSAKFDELFKYEGDDLGPTYNHDYTVFKLWAPLASNVILHYELNSSSYDIVMEKKDKGIFKATINGDLENALYYYLVTNNEITNKVIDPYAFSCNANGNKSAIINLDRLVLLNENKLDYIPFNKAIIYELSVRDFSMDGSLGNEEKGKFNAFLKEGYTTKKGNKIGIDYLASLGVSHIQLMPVLDFVTVDENHPFESYNWGYDPNSYNNLEGSYSTNPNDSYARINEFRELVNKLHQKNLRVVLDVVFNHTYYFKESIYQKIIPNYFYLMDNHGNLSNGSYCGNDIDTTKYMVRKYFIDMCKRYVKYFNIDGLRFDLMGILDASLVLKIKEECLKINPNFICYGEGWNMPSFLPLEKRASLNNAKQLNEIGFFNDFFRDTLTGKVNNKQIIKGYLAGNISLATSFLKAMRGSIEDKCYFNEITSSLNYSECHDNLTLFDKLLITNPDLSNEQRNDIQLCVLAATILALGASFIHSGMEFNRSKKGYDNTYNLPDEINMLDWTQVDIYEKNIKALKDFIKIKNEHKCFAINKRKEALNYIDGKILISGAILITYAYQDEIIVLIFNPNSKKEEITLNGDYKLFANQYGYIDELDKSYNKIKIRPYSLLMLKK